MAKGATDRQAAEVVAWALEIGLLNEEEYAKILARHYQARGMAYIKSKTNCTAARFPAVLGAGPGGTGGPGGIH